MTEREKDSERHTHRERGLLQNKTNHGHTFKSISPSANVISPQNLSIFPIAKTTGSIPHNSGKIDLWFYTEKTNKHLQIPLTQQKNTHYLNY